MAIRVAVGAGCNAVLMGIAVGFRVGCVTGAVAGDGGWSSWLVAVGAGDVVGMTDDVRSGVTTIGVTVVHSGSGVELEHAVTANITRKATTSSSVESCCNIEADTREDPSFTVKKRFGFRSGSNRSGDPPPAGFGAS